MVGKQNIFLTVNFLLDKDFVPLVPFVPISLMFLKFPSPVEFGRTMDKIGTIEKNCAGYCRPML
jgi:hypothetical protein